MDKNYVIEASDGRRVRVCTAGIVLSETNEPSCYDEEAARSIAVELNGIFKMAEVNVQLKEVPKA